MLRRLTMIILPLFLVTVSTSAAQTPGATPAASPATATSAWSITDSREIQVDGTPIALSPDGQWLAGIGPGKNEVCVWDAETLNPSCVDIGGSIEAFFGGMRLTWAPDSSAFAFSTSDLARLVYGNIYVFDVDQGTASNLTNLDTENNDDAPLYIGASWTPDNQDIIFTIMHGLVAESPAPEIGRISREGGEVETIELPDDWTGADNMMTPPIASADGNLYFVIAGDNDSAGIWRMAPDDSPRNN